MRGSFFWLFINWCKWLWMNIFSVLSHQKKKKKAGDNLFSLLHFPEKSSAVGLNTMTAFRYQCILCGKKNKAEENGRKIIDTLCGWYHNLIFKYIYFLYADEEILILRFPILPRRKLRWLFYPYYHYAINQIL